jgi:hypothetical protein
VYWKPPSQYDGAYSAASFVLGELLLPPGRLCRSRTVRRRFLGVGSRFFAGLWLLLLLRDIHFGAFETARGIGCADDVRTLSTSTVLWTTPSLFAGGVISAFVSSLEVAVEQQQQQQHQ